MDRAQKKAGAYGNVSSNRKKGAYQPLPLVATCKFTKDHISGPYSTPRDLIKILQCCSTCGKIPAQVFSTCEDRHIICLECAQPRSHCPYAGDRAGYGQRCGKRLEESRCYPFSEIMNNSLVLCPENSCRESLYGFELSRHERHCEGIPFIKCLYSRCRRPSGESLFTKKDFLIHLMDKHDCNLYKPRCGLVCHEVMESKSELGVWKVAFIIEFENIFLVCVYGREILEKNPSLVIIVYCVTIDTSDRIHDRFGTIKVYDDQLIPREYKGVFPSIRNTKESIIQEYNCLVIPNGLVSKSSFFIDVKIKPRKMG